MKTSILTSLFLFVFIVSYSQKYKVANHTDANGFSYQTISNNPVDLRVYTLKNGLTVYLSRNTDLPEINYALAVRAGSAYDPKDNTGLAHYLEHLLFNGTDKIGSLDWQQETKLQKQIEDLYETHKATNDTLEKRKLYRTIDSLSYEASRYGIKGEYRKLVTGIGGAGVNGTTNFEYIIYGAVMPAPSLSKFLLLEKERFSHPAFRAFNTELEIVYEEFNTLQDNDFIQKYYPAIKLLFNQHPYGSQTPIGKADHLKNPSIKAIKEYFNTFYVPNNMAVILVGDFKYDSVIQLVNQAFAQLRYNEIKKPAFLKALPLTTPLEQNVYSANPPSTFIGFRLGAVGTEDEKYLTLINKLLTNNIAGMLNLELVNQQKLNSALSIGFYLNDYSIHFLSGTPNEGQTLEDVRDKLLSALDMIKEGEFDESILKACARDIKQSYLKQITDYHNLDAECAFTFTRYQSWAERLKFLDDLESVTKEQLINFVKKKYNNYVIVYKRQGSNNDLVKVENPKITPIILNENKESAWAKKFNTTKPGEIKPEFVDFKKELHHTKLSNGLILTWVPDDKSKLFKLDIIFDAGKSNDKMIPLAVNYINFAGTSKYSLNEWKKEFYKLGLSFSINAGNEQTIFHLEGLNESMEKGIWLVDHLLQDIADDGQSFKNYINGILDERNTSLTNKRKILQALVNKVLYDEHSAFRNIYSNKELENFKADDLVSFIKALRNYRHRFFYYGSEPELLKEILEKKYHAPKPVREFPLAEQYPVVPTKSVVYFANFEAAQAEVEILSRGEKFDIHTMALSNMFNRFIEKVAFHEIREARSLAYNNWAAHFMSEDTVNYNYMEIYAGTQVNKLNDLLNVAVSLTRNIDSMKSVFNEAKADQLKRYQRERVTGTNIFYNYETFKKQGIYRDYRENMYNEILKMDFEDIKRFFKENIAGRNSTIVIVGDKKEIDLKALEHYGEVIEVDSKSLFNY